MEKDLEETKMELLKSDCLLAFHEFDFEDYEWIRLQQEAFSEEGIMNAALYLWGRMKKAKKIEIWLLQSRKKINRWYQKNKGFKVYPDVHDFNYRGKFTHVYQYLDEEGYFYFESLITPSEIVKYMIGNQMLVPVGKIEHQNSPHSAWTIKI
jgi:hypothetical protein